MSNFTNSTDGVLNENQSTDWLVQLIILGMLSGFIFEISLQGILGTILQLVQFDNNHLSSSITVFFNTSAFVYTALFNWNYFLDESSCVVGHFWVNLAKHCLEVSFDVYLLYKVYALTASNWVNRTIAGLLLTRFSWAIADLSKSDNSFWSTTSLSCVNFQNRITGIGCYVVDIICVAFSAIASVRVSLQVIDFDVSRIIIEPLAVLTAISWGIYVDWNVTDPFILNLARLIRVWVFVRCINAKSISAEQYRPSVYDPVRKSRAESLSDVEPGSGRDSEVTVAKTQMHSQSGENRRESNFSN